MQPLAGERFYVRLVAEAGDLSRVICRFADKYEPGHESDLALAREATDGVRDYWTGVLPVPTSRLRYFFHLTGVDGSMTFLSEHGFTPAPPPRRFHAGYFFYPYDLPADRFALPGWVLGTISRAHAPGVRSRRRARSSAAISPASGTAWRGRATSASDASISRRSSPRRRITSTTPRTTTRSIRTSEAARTSRRSCASRTQRAYA